MEAMAIENRISSNRIKVTYHNVQHQADHYEDERNYCGFERKIEITTERSQDVEDAHMTLNFRIGVFPLSIFFLQFLRSFL